MCLAMPAQIIHRYGDKALVNYGGVELEVDVSLVPAADHGDFVVIHVGIALSLVSPEEAQETFEMLRNGAIGDANDE
jgi:hydrogenase expression/formation protein HypC